MALTTKAAHGKDKSTALKGVEMQHRHFACIARIIKQSGFHGFSSEQQEAMARMFAHELRGTNAKFNAPRFLLACGVEG